MLTTVNIGPLSAIYVGASTSTSPLTQLTTQRTGGGTFQYDVPEEFLDVAQNSVQNGRAELRLNLTFLGMDPNVIKLAMGNLLSANQDDPPSFATYSLLLVNPDSTSNLNIYIPTCYTEKKAAFNFNKDRVSVVPLSFVYFNRNRFVKLFYMNTLANLVSPMGPQYPF